MRIPFWTRWRSAHKMGLPLNIIDLRPLTIPGLSIEYCYFDCAVWPPGIRVGRRGHITVESMATRDDHPSALAKAPAEAQEERDDPRDPRDPNP